MNYRLLLRMARLVRNPPSAARVKLVLAVLGFCLALFAYEQMFGWPEALSIDPSARRGFKSP